MKSMEKSLFMKYGEILKKYSQNRYTKNDY